MEIQSRGKAPTKSRMMILGLLFIALAFLGAGLMAIVVQLGRSILNAETTIQELAMQTSEVRARVDAMHARHLPHPSTIPVPSHNPPRPPTATLAPAAPGGRLEGQEHGRRGDEGVLGAEAVEEGNAASGPITSKDDGTTDQSELGSRAEGATPGDEVARRGGHAELDQCRAAQLARFDAAARSSSRGHKPFGWGFASDPEFYQHIPAVARNNASNCAIIDVGSNKARKLLAVIQAVHQAQARTAEGALGCHYYAYEPVAPTFHIGQSAIVSKLSPAAQEYVHPIHRGIAHQVGSMSIGWNSDSGDLGASLSGPGRFRRSEVVNVSTIDQEIQQTAGRKHVAVLKVDVEGYEAKSLQGARASLTAGVIDCVVWERHPHWASSLKLPSFVYEINEVAGYGYHVYFQDDDTFLRVDGEYWHDKLEPRQFKLDAIAVRIDHPLNRFLQSKMLPDCQH